MTTYQSWLQSNIEFLHQLGKLKQYPYLYKALRANGDRLRRFLIALLDMLKFCVAGDGEKLPEQHGCAPVMATEQYISKMLIRAGIEPEAAGGKQLHYNLVLLHSFWLIKRVIRPRAQFETPSEEAEIPKFLYADLYTDSQLAKIEDRVRRWAIVTGRRKRLSKDDIIWLYGQRDADLVFIPSTRSETDASLEATDRFITAYRSAKASKHNSQPVTISDVSYQLRRLYNQDTAKIRDTIHRANIPLFMEYGLQNRQMTAEEKSQYGITDRTYWAIMPVPEKIIEEMRDKRTYWEQEEEPDGELIF